MHFHTSLTANSRTALKIVIYIQLSTHFTTTDVVTRQPTGHRSIRVQSSQHISVLRTHSRYIINQVGSRTVSVKNLIVHPFQTATCKIDTQTITIISQFQQLSITTFLQEEIFFLFTAAIARIFIKFITSIYIFSLHRKTGTLQVDTTGKTVIIRFSTFFFQIYRYFLKRTVQSRSL